MTATRLPADEVFFAEWSRLRQVTKRSIPRAAMLAGALGVPLRETTAIVVVGSKGKATAATAASAALAAAGHRVGTITSPPILTNRERIRVDGRAISEHTYDALAIRVREAVETLPAATMESGYLSPAGMYMVAGIDHCRREGCDVLVVEAGMGGRSDEVSLLDPAVLAVTPIFEEHVPILGRNVEEITAEKLGAAGPRTKIVRAPALASSVETGLAAAQLVDEKASLAGMTLSLPGRMTWHSDAEGRQWLADAAVNSIAVARAIAAAGPFDFVLVSLPEGKDISRTVALLDEQMRNRWLPVLPPNAEHLAYSAESWGRPLVSWPEALNAVQACRRIAALGSWSFMSAVLEHLGVDGERAFFR